MEKKCQRLRRITYVLVIVLIIVVISSAFLIVRGGVLEKVLIKLNVVEEEEETDWTLFSWESSLEKMDYDADIVFFGDSITRGGDFQDAFEDVSIVNLGLSGDSISGMIDRVEMISYVTPEKIFVLAGINSLSGQTTDEVLSEYAELLQMISEENPDSEIFIQSLLPLTEEKEADYIDNETIEEFNSDLEELAESMGLTFINIYDLYVEDGYLNEAYSKDGIHIQDEAYELWYDAIEEYIYE